MKYSFLENFEQEYSNNDNLQGPTPNIPTIIIDGTNKSGLLTVPLDGGGFSFPTCGVVGLDDSKTGKVNNVTLTCHYDDSLERATIKCDDGKTNCCGTGSVPYSIIYNNGTFACVGSAPISADKGFECKDDFTCNTCDLRGVNASKNCKIGSCENRTFCNDCGRNNNCGGNGKCIGGSCKCNDGFFGVHCENKNCLLVPPGDCEVVFGNLTNNCNKSLKGCEYSPKIITNPSPAGVITTCACDPDFKEEDYEDTVWTVTCPDWQKDDSIFKRKNNNYWNDNKNHWGDGDAICRSNFGSGSKQNGGWNDCGKHGGQWYTSSVQCKAPKGSKQNIPWAWFQNQ